MLVDGQCMPHGPRNQHLLTHATLLSSVLCYLPPPLQTYKPGPVLQVHQAARRGGGGHAPRSVKGTTVERTAYREASCTHLGLHLGNLSGSFEANIGTEYLIGKTWFDDVRYCIVHQLMGAGTSRAGPRSAVVVPKQSLYVTRDSPSAVGNDGTNRAEEREELNAFGDSFEVSSQRHTSIYTNHAQKVQFSVAGENSGATSAGTPGLGATSDSMCQIGSTKTSAAASLTSSQAAGSVLGSLAASHGAHASGSRQGPHGDDDAAGSSPPHGSEQHEQPQPPPTPLVQQSSCTVSTQTDDAAAENRCGGLTSTSYGGSSAPQMPDSWKKGEAIGSGSFGMVYLGLNNDTGEWREGEVPVDGGVEKKSERHDQGHSLQLGQACQMHCHV